MDTSKGPLPPASTPLKPSLHFNQASLPYPDHGYSFYQKALELERKMERDLRVLCDKVTEQTQYKLECQIKDNRIQELTAEVASLHKEIQLLMEYKEKTEKVIKDHLNPSKPDIQVSESPPTSNSFYSSHSILDSTSLGDISGVPAKKSTKDPLAASSTAIPLRRTMMALRGIRHYQNKPSSHLSIHAINHSRVVESDTEEMNPVYGE